MKTPKATRIHYRLADDPLNGHSLWSGAVTVWRKVTAVQARKLVADALHVKRLPANTLVVTNHDLEAGQWTEAEIRAETTKVASADKKTRKEFVDVADVPLTAEDVQDMLKKFGLA